MLSALSFALLASAVNVLTAVLALVGQPLLRPRLHPLAQALDAAEHRHRRSRRRGAPARRLRGSHGQPGATGALALPHRLPLDPPHFWALALMIKNAYAAAGVPMLPVVRGDRETARQIVLYSLAMVAFTVVVGFWSARSTRSRPSRSAPSSSRSRSSCVATSHGAGEAPVPLLPRSTSPCSSRPRLSTRCSCERQRPRSA